MDLCDVCNVETDYISSSVAVYCSDKCQAQDDHELCDVCDEPAYHICQGCNLAVYCSVECQAKDYNEHEDICYIACGQEKHDEDMYDEDSDEYDSDSDEHYYCGDELIERSLSGKASSFERKRKRKNKRRKRKAKRKAKRKKRKTKREGKKERRKTRREGRKGRRSQKRTEKREARKTAKTAEREAKKSEGGGAGMSGDTKKGLAAGAAGGLAVAGLKEHIYSEYL